MVGTDTRVLHDTVVVAEQIMDKKMLIIRDFGEIYGPSRTRTYEFINSRKLCRVKFGARTYIPVEDAEAWRDELLRAQADASKDQGRV
jgi:hypothetical protein